MLPIIEVKNLSKKYRIRHLPGGYLSLREKLLSVLRFRADQEEDFWALKDVTFNVSAGSSLGIIGKNGAGKSTLLKILSRITYPSSGEIFVRGRVASLLEVGTGFHPELTGRENIFFNGSLMGMKKKEIDRRFDEIVDFSGVEQFLDTPLKHYSSGMQLRLAFSVAAFLEPEILVIDEVLAVGDAEFQKKCIGKMEDVNSSGRTILFVSHNMAAVEDLCEHAIMLSNGKIVKIGTSKEVSSYYQNSFGGWKRSLWEASNPNEPAYFSKISVSVAGDQPRQQLLVDLEIRSLKPHKNLFLAIDISNSMGQTIMQAIPSVSPFIRFSQESQTLQVAIELPPLVPDQYYVSVWIGSHFTETMCWEKEIVSFDVTESPTPGRNYPHSHHSGFIVPISRILG